MKKTITAFLALAIMLISIIPASVFAAGEGYEVWVAGIEITSENASAVTGEGISGTVSYDAATKTLTLNNTTITKCHEFAVFDDHACIYSEHELTIELVGENTLNATENGGSSYGIYLNEGNLTFKGNGSLLAEACALSDDYYWSVGIFADDNIIIADECTIIAATGNVGARADAAIYPYGDIVLEGEVKAEGNLTAADDSALEEMDLENFYDYKYVKISPLNNPGNNPGTGVNGVGLTIASFVALGALTLVGVSLKKRSEVNN